MADKPKFKLGQRWASDTESDLGLGLVSGVDKRTVTVVFPASEQRRTYAISDAPLSRVLLNPGETARSGDDWEIKIDRVREQNGVLVYEGMRTDTGKRTRLPETELDSFVQITDARSRLFNAQVDPNRWFEIRATTHQRLDQVQGSPAYGLAGVRIDLIPHQLYIAREISTRFAPRALLADEVGLGKTIEACLILHRQLLTGRVRRVLIIVPDPLLHQWLVELLRRFNLRFKLFDEQRCEASQEPDRGLNPFDTEQLILSPLSLFDSGQRRSEALAVEWDLVIVDEAHHLEWKPDCATPLYDFAAALAGSVPGLLLLTATPEQLGEQGHFGRLKLLDAARFIDFDAFMQEQLEYRRISAVVDALISNAQPPASAVPVIRELLNEEVSTSTPEQRRGLIAKLIDRHGPSRVLFRNTRSNIKGFPNRRVHPLVLPAPTRYLQAAESSGHIPHPELGAADEWVELDPRVSALVETVRRLRGEKVLVICALVETVIGLERALRRCHGVHAAVFHERTSLVARDRAAHFFADPDGSRLLLCSEIGSEGRNFQFCHHLILFDLPLKPDVLEQRIGRLDRIGQKKDIDIHVPYLEPGAQAVLFRWYHDGLDAFRQTCAVGQSVYQEIEQQLLAAIRAGSAPPDLIDRTRHLYRQKQEALEQGRDRLLEISSFDPSTARTIVDAVRDLDTLASNEAYMTQVFDAYGVQIEHKDGYMHTVRPSDHMQSSYFPFLRADGMTVTFDRSTALAHEDVEFLTWEHPMTQGAMDLVLTGDHGKAAVIGVDFSLLPQGTVLVETVHTLELVAPDAPELRRFLETTVMRMIRDEASGRDLRRLLQSDHLFNKVRDLDRTVATSLVNLKRRSISAAIDQNELDVQREFGDVVARARSALSESTELELQRLAYLQSMKASVRPEELELVRKQLSASLDLLASARSRLDAVRLIVTI